MYEKEDYTDQRSGGGTAYQGVQDYDGTYEDIPSIEERAVLLQSSQYTDSLTAEQRSDKLKDGIQMVALLVVGLLSIGVMLVYLDFVLVPLVFSRFLVYIFQPFINYLVGKKAFPLCKARCKLPRWLAVIIVLILLVFLFALFGLIISVSITDVVDNADVYKDRAKDLMESLIAFASNYGYTREEIEAMIPHIDFGAYAVSVLNQLSSILTQMSLVLLIVVYMLLDYDGSNKSALRATIDIRIRKYIIIHSVISILTGIGTWLVLVVFGVNLSLFLGFMAFVLNYIPNIGSVLGVLLPLPFVVFKENFQLWHLLAVAVLLALGQFVSGQVIEPKILGNAIDIPPITVICALLFWGALWGIIGAILSIPLTVAIQLYLDSIDHPASKALAGMIIGDFKMFDNSPPRTKDANKGDVEVGAPARPTEHTEEENNPANSYGGYYGDERYYDDQYPPYDYKDAHGDQPRKETSSSGRRSKF